jgi:hypothetical protein
MTALLIKTLLTAIFIVALSEVGRRAPTLAGLIVALPLATAMTMVLMHIDGEGMGKIATFARASLLFLPPSTVFVAVMWTGAGLGLNFWAVLAAALAATLAAFWAYARLLAHWGLPLF